MSTSPRMMKACVLLLSGAALGAGGGYAASASGASATHPPAAKATAKRTRGELARLRRAVSITAVVPDGKGTFATLSIERGTLVSVTGNSISLREGNARAAYKTVNISLPSTTVVRLAGKPSSLSALSAGERIMVVQGPRRTTVSARTPKSAHTPSALGAESQSAS